jgi:hypothetical protein
VGHRRPCSRRAGKHCFDFGGLDIQVCFQRYPASLTTFELELTTQINPPAGKRTPYFVKAIQSDGHMAWSSPIYIDNLETK